MEDREAAQAVELVRALRHQLHNMTTQLARVERQHVTGRTGRERRMEAAELRRDIKEAQTLIDQLEHRYLNRDEHTQQHPASRQRPNDPGPASQVISSTASKPPGWPGRPRI